MKLEIRGRGFSITPALRDRVERRLAYALGRFDEHISSVRVTLEDLNGPRGGVDKRCAIEVRGKELLVRIEESDVSCYVAIDHAAERAAVNVVRALDRVRASSQRRAAVVLRMGEALH